MRSAIAAFLVLWWAAGAGAHMVVLPETSTAGGTERYTLLVPTEGDSATVKVELRLPMGVQVAAVESKPGWQATNEPFPIGAATVRWAGGRIPPGEMLTFEFLAVNPPSERVLTWNATQWYENGSSDRWGTGAPEDHQASTTTLLPVPAGAAPHEHEAHGHAGSAGADHPDHDASAAAPPAHALAPPAASARAEPPDAAPLRIALLSLVLSAAALVVALRRR